MDEPEPQGYREEGGERQHVLRSIPADVDAGGEQQDEDEEEDREDGGIAERIPRAERLAEIPEEVQRAPAVDDAGEPGCEWDRRPKELPVEVLGQALGKEQYRPTGMSARAKPPPMLSTFE